MRGGWALVAALIVAACGADESTSDSIPATATTATPTTPPPVATAAPSPSSAAPSTTAVVTPAPSPTTSVPSPQGELDGDWQVTSGIVNDEAVQLIDSAPITLTVDGSDLSGTAACNGYGATASFGDGRVTVGGTHSTEMACEPAESMQLEQLYLSSIGPSATYRVDGSTLTWQTPTATWVFTRVPPVPPSPLVGTTWVLNGVIDEFGAFTVAGIEAAHIVFDADGTFAGSTGCRDVAGTWTVADAIVSTDDATIEGDCAGPLVDVDEVVVQVLEAGFNGHIEGDHLAARPRENLGLDYFAA